MKKLQLLIILGLIFLYACQPEIKPEVTPTNTLTPKPNETLTATLSPTPSPTSTPQPRQQPANYGPELEDFPTGYNPLTGLPVQDPSMLNLPAVLVSISNMPVTARPQAGLSFAPWVFELFIGEGSTRFMSVFYGDYPRSIPDVSGNCPVREERFIPDDAWIGNRVWLDENADGRANAWEVGVGGICIHLFDAASGERLASTSSDSNGYYGFEIQKDTRYFLEFDLPSTYQFTDPDVGDDNHDSDVNPASGQTPAFQPTNGDSSRDAGLLLFESPTAIPSPVATGTPLGWYIPPEDYVGPIRSGRLTYNHIKYMFTDSCLVYASAGRGIREALDGCEIIFGVDRTTPNSSLLTVRHMRELAVESKVPNQPINYSGNLFSAIPPEGGQPATGIHVFYHDYTQSRWEYDPVSGSYLRYTDLADGTATFVPATDRLTGRQLAFENVIVILAPHDRIRHLQFDIDLGIGQEERAYLFRDGQLFRGAWSTANREWEKESGYIRPIHFIDSNDNPIPLKHGRTWIHLFTPESYLEDYGEAQWEAHFVQPYDPIDTPEPD
ncbi:MAG: SdrD B-like domain-containing protein [Anaerolineales bacterium]